VTRLKRAKAKLNQTRYSTRARHTDTLSNNKNVLTQRSPKNKTIVDPLGQSAPRACSRACGSFKIDVASKATAEGSRGATEPWQHVLHERSAPVFELRACIPPLLLRRTPVSALTLASVHPTLTSAPILASAYPRLVSHFYLSRARRPLQHNILPTERASR
jgi:hypothetical protein